MCWLYLCLLRASPAWIIASLFMGWRFFAWRRRARGVCTPDWHRQPDHLSLILRRRQDLLLYGHRTGVPLIHHNAPGHFLSLKVVLHNAGHGAVRLSDFRCQALP